MGINVGTVAYFADLSHLIFPSICSITVCTAPFMSTVTIRSLILVSSFLALEILRQH